MLRVTSTSVSDVRLDTDPSSSSSVLTNRSKSSPEKSTEELLIEKLDNFLSSIESRLDSFEQYFKFNENVLDDIEIDSDATKLLSEQSRRGSSSSLTSIKSFSEKNLNMIHQRLDVIKQSVLKTSFTNLEYLYKTLDDQYNYLFASGRSMSPSEDGDTSADSISPLNRKEILSKNIITTIQYFDDKLNQVENLIQHKTPQASIGYDKDSKFKYFKFYNFNKALKTAENGYLHYYQLPLSWRENRYIIQGYRFSMKHTTLFKSVFHFNHNESMNIWSHLLGFFVLLYITLVHFPSSKAYQMNTSTDNIAMYVFLAAAMQCLGCSVVWHTYSCFAKLQTRAKCACVDYTGITTLITASVIAAEYCSLYNYSTLLRIWITFSTICGVSGFSFNWSPYFDRADCRSLRIAFFMGLAFLGVSAFFCMCFYEGFVKSGLFFSPLIYKSFVWYWIGVVFYGGLIPERWRYDVIIDEDDTCHHSHTTSEILTGNVENSGREEIEEIELEIEEKDINETDSLLHDDYEETNIPEPEEAPASDDVNSDHYHNYRDIIDSHFPVQPNLTPYHKDFFSLWWVDYVLSSHNLWHVCVVLGIIGHYSSLLEMYENIDRVVG